MVAAASQNLSDLTEALDGILNTVSSVSRAEERALLMLLRVLSDVEAPVPVPSPHTHHRQLDGF